MKKIQGWFLVMMALAGISCRSTSGRMIAPLQENQIVWTEEELAKPIALRTLHQTQEASYHMVRVRTAEDPHTHDGHDLVVFVMKGKIRIHFKDRFVDTKPGDVIEIGRGEIHWGENLGSEAGEAYAVFTPPFDPSDRHPAPKP